MFASTTENLLLAGVILLAIILIVAVVTLITMWRRANSVIRVGVNSQQVSDIMDQAMSTVRHATDVSAVLKLIEQLDEQPDALELIKSYPATMVAASWLHYTNGLGASLQLAQDNLQSMHKLYLRSPRAIQIADAQASVDALRKKLHEAANASGQMLQTAA